MTSPTILSKFDVHNCRECQYRKVFEDGRMCCILYNIGPTRMDGLGCEFGTKIQN